MSVQPHTGFRRAFTLAELLVVIGIVVLLVGLLLPAMVKERRTGHDLQCASNLRTIGQGIAAYQGEWGGKFPPGWVNALMDQSNPPQPVNRPGGPNTTWYEALAPYIGPRGMGPASDAEAGRPRTVYRCPVAQGSAKIISLGVPVPQVSYVLNEQVLKYCQDGTWPSPNGPAHNAWYFFDRPTTVPHAAKQMMLGESYLGCGPNWTQIAGDTESNEPNRSVWLLKPDMKYALANARNGIYPWHSGFTRSNVFMADLHVEMGVTPRQGWIERYQNPGRRNENPPLPAGY